MENLSSAGSPTTSFELFLLLPAELRLKIWRYIANLPRSIRFRYRWRLSVAPIGVGVPSILHVCAEARQAALMDYKLSFATSPGPAQIYFNAMADTAFFGNFNEHEIHPNMSVAGRRERHHNCMTHTEASTAHKQLRLFSARVVDVDQIRSMTVYLHRNEVPFQYLRHFEGLQDLTLMVWMCHGENRETIRLLLDRYEKDRMRTIQAYPSWTPPRVSIFSAHSGQRLSLNSSSPS